MSEEEFAKLRDSFDFLPANTIDPHFREKCNQLIGAIMNFRKNENIAYLNTRSSENFLKYFDTQSRKARYCDLPENCTHVKVAYYTYWAQGNNADDPTAIGRKIKKMYIMVGLAEPDSGQQPAKHQQDTQRLCRDLRQEKKQRRYGQVHQPVHERRSDE